MGARTLAAAPTAYDTLKVFGAGASCTIALPSAMMAATIPSIFSELVRLYQVRCSLPRRSAPKRCSPSSGGSGGRRGHPVAENEVIYAFTAQV